MPRAGLLRRRRSAVDPTLYITTAGYTCNLCGDTGARPVVMQGFSSFTGYIDYQGYSYTSFSAPSVTTSPGSINMRSAAITTINMSSLTTNGNVFDFYACPLTSINFAALTGTGAHLYLSGAYVTGSAGLSGGVSFPALTSIVGGALVFSRRYQLTSFSAPNLVTLTNELELDYCKALTSLSLPALTTINYNAGNGWLILGGDPPDIGQSRPNALSSISLPALTTILGKISCTYCVNVTSIDPSSWTTIGNGFGLDFNRCDLTQANMDAILAKLVAIRGGVTSGSVDLRFQNGGQTPSVTGQTNAATLVAAGITVSY